MARVAIVGGGAAGLSAALTLSELGAQVAVFEQGAVWGGRARSEVVENCIVDVGAQLFGSGFSALFELARAVGAQDRLTKSPGRDAVWRGGRVHPITYGNVASMVTSTALPTRLKIKLATRYVPFLLRHGNQLDASDLLARGGDALDGESVAEWGRRELGDDFVNLLAYPLLGAYYGSTPETTSVVLYHALARAGLDVSVHALRGGTGAFFQMVSEHLATRGGQLQVNQPISKVEVGATDVSVDGELFDGAVLAVPPMTVSKLFQSDPATSDWLRGVHFAPSAVLALVLDTRIPAGYFGISIPREAKASELVALCVQHEKAAGLVPPDRSLLIALGAPAHNESFIAQPETAVERMVSAVELLMPGTRSHILRAKLYRHEYGYPIFYPGYLKHLRAYATLPQTQRVKLAGDYLVSPTVEGAIRSGRRAAQQLYDQLRAG
jgi:oxygen-dependent protoporphyrinogen oxidase